MAADVILQLPHAKIHQLTKVAIRLKHNQAFHYRMERVWVLSVLS